MQSSKTSRKVHKTLQCKKSHIFGHKNRFNFAAHQLHDKRIYHPVFIRLFISFYEVMGHFFGNVCKNVCVCVTFLCYQYLVPYHGIRNKKHTPIIIAFECVAWNVLNSYWNQMIGKKKTTGEFRYWSSDGHHSAVDLKICLSLWHIRQLLPVIWAFLSR